MKRSTTKKAAKRPAARKTARARRAKARPSLGRKVLDTVREVTGMLRAGDRLVPARTASGRSKLRVSRTRRIVGETE